MRPQCVRDNKFLLKLLECSGVDFKRVSDCKINLQVDNAVRLTVEIIVDEQSWAEACKTGAAE